MRCLVALASLFVSVSSVALSRRLQSVAVTGRLLCNGKPYEHARVKLYDVDFGLPDDLMAEGRSDAKGAYVLQGSETEFAAIDPKLNIYHNCNDEKVECWRKIEIHIPKDFIADGPRPTKTFDAGTLNLSGVFPGESRDCLN